MGQEPGFWVSYSMKSRPGSPSLTMVGAPDRFTCSGQETDFVGYEEKQEWKAVEGWAQTVPKSRDIPGTVKAK